MALIKCTECGSNVSDKALNCPKCGCPIEISIEKRNESKRKRIKHIFLGVIILIIIFLLSLGIYKFVKRPDTSGYYNGFKWGMTYAQVQDQLGDDAIEGKDNKSLLIRYGDYEGNKNINAIVSYDCTDDFLNAVTILMTIGDDSSFTDKSLVNEYVEKFDKLYGEHEKDMISYTWETEKSKVTVSNLVDGLVGVDYKDIAKAED